MVNYPPNPIQEKEKGLTGDLAKAMEELKKVRGHIVSHPLDFLKDDLQVSWKLKAPVAKLISKAPEAQLDPDHPDYYKLPF